MNNTERQQYAEKVIREGRMAFQRELIAETLSSAKRLRAAYKNSKDVITKRLDDFQILAQSEGMTTAALANEAALIRLRDAIQETLSGMTGIIKREASSLGATGIAAGRAVGIVSIGATYGGKIARPSLKQLHERINYADSTDFQSQLGNYGEYHAQRVVDMVRQGDGKSPALLARQVTNYLREFPVADAVRMTGTLGLWSLRSATHDVYLTNREIVSGWIWAAKLDLRTCMGCFAMNGRVFPSSVVLNDHHLGRCAPLPLTPAWSREIIGAITTGEQVFRQFDEAKQKKIMGAARWQAWQDGLFGFDQLSTTYHDGVYGPMRRASSLDQLVGRDTADRYRRQAA